MSKKLCISNISYSVDEDDLEDLFSEYGGVVESTIAVDKNTLESRGFGFITYRNESEAENAILKLNGHFFKGRVLNVKLAEEKYKQQMSTPYRSPEFVQNTIMDGTPRSSRIKIWTPTESRKNINTRTNNANPNPNQFKRRQRREKIHGMGE